MSDFDKEAERKKLREKYEDDKEDREATQRMSDLLLKGATMTNSHCGVCGDPFFTQDGTTFCPTCHGSPDAVEGTGLEQQAGSSEGQSDQGESDASADAEADVASRNVDAANATDAASNRTQDAADPQTTDQPTGTQKHTDSRATSIDVSAPTDRSQSADTEPGRDSPTPTRDTHSESSASQPPSRASGAPNAGRPAQSHASGDRATAQAALTQTLEYFSQEAAATDDPRYAKECLEAAREAAQTLSALR